jgi:hypothetical protein
VLEDQVLGGGDAPVDPGLPGQVKTSDLASLQHVRLGSLCDVTGAVGLGFIWSSRRSSAPGRGAVLFRDEGPVVGRDAELAILEGALTSGQPGLVLVVGGPRTGKAALDGVDNAFPWKKVS